MTDQRERREGGRGGQKWQKGFKDEVHESVFENLNNFLMVCLIILTTNTETLYHFFSDKIMVAAIAVDERMIFS